MFTRTRLLHLPAHAVRTMWWAGVPVGVLGTLVLVDRPSLPPFLSLGVAAAAIWPASPLAAELLAEYPFTIVATLLAAALAAWSHRRRSAAMRPHHLLPRHPLPEPGPLVRMAGHRRPRLRGGRGIPRRLRPR